MTTLQSAHMAHTLLRPTHGLGVAALLDVQAPWSLATFGPGPRTLGIVEHIRKEVDEVRAQPMDPSEWVDIAILSLDAVWRSDAGWFDHAALAAGRVEDTILADMAAGCSGRSVADALATIEAHLDAITLRPGSRNGVIFATRNRLRFQSIAAIALAGGPRWCALRFSWFREELWDKLERNRGRQWPDWRNYSQDAAIEHVRTAGAV